MPRLQVPSPASHSSTPTHHHTPPYKVQLSPVLPSPPLFASAQLPVPIPISTTAYHIPLHHPFLYRSPMAHMSYPYWFHGSGLVSPSDLVAQPATTPQLTHDNPALLENYQSNPADFEAIRNTIQRLSGQRTSGGGSGQQHMAPPRGAAPQGQNGYYNSHGSYNAGGSGIYPQNHGYSNGGAVGGTYPGASRTPHTDKLFKNTPFYAIESRIGPIHQCQGKSALGPLALTACRG